MYERAAGIFFALDLIFSKRQNVFKNHFFAILSNSEKFLNKNITTLPGQGKFVYLSEMNSA